jgi:hypothetical protein
MKNKGQLKIQEMMFMLLGVFLFFMLVGLFVITILNSSIRQSANKIAEDSTILAVRSLSNSPEFICVDSRTNCVDEDKLIGLIKSSNYKNFWPFSSLMIVKYSGFNKNESQMIKCNSDNYPNCDVFSLFDKNKSERKVASFVALCRKELEGNRVYDKCEVARIIAGVEVKS